MELFTNGKRHLFAAAAVPVPVAAATCSQFSATKVAHVAAEGVNLQSNPTQRRILRRPHAKARLWTIANFFSEQECEFVRKTLEEHLHRCADGYDLGDLAVEDVAFPTKHRTCVKKYRGRIFQRILSHLQNFLGWCAGWTSLWRTLRRANPSMSSTGFSLSNTGKVEDLTCITTETITTFLRPQWSSVAVQKAREMEERRFFQT